MPRCATSPPDTVICAIGNIHGRPGAPMAEQSDHDRMWIRKAFLDSDVDHGAVIAHGHGISAHPVIRPNRIGIDTGAPVATC